MAKSVTIYCDGSGKGYVCAMFDYGEGYQRTYFGRINDQVFHEYRAILFALEKLEEGGPDLNWTEHKYILYNDNAGAIQHITGEAKPPTNIIEHLVEEIQKKTEHLDIEFKWVRRGENLAGRVLDNKARQLFSNRGSSNNLERKLQNPNRYAHWPPEERCPKCGDGIESTGACKQCGFVPNTGKIRM